MSLEENKEVISRFLQRGFNQRDLTVVDEVFASDHVLRSPLTGVEGGILAPRRSREHSRTTTITRRVLGG